MNINRYVLTLALTLVVGACAQVTTYSEAEAPKQLKLDSATTQIDVRFAPGSATIAPADAARLRQAAASGAIGPADRVTVAAAGAPGLAERRVSAVSSVLLRYGIVSTAEPLAEVSPERAVVAVTRTLVTLPACPNWSKPSSMDYGNQPSSNFGCSTETNLGLMVANPSDLASGLPAGGTAGHPAAAAVSRYLNDKVELPTANSGLPVAQPTSSTPQNSPSSTGGSP